MPPRERVYMLQGSGMIYHKLVNPDIKEMKVIISQEGRIDYNILTNYKISLKYHQD